MATLRCISRPGKRKGFRGELERMAKANPHWSDDIGLGQSRGEVEIAKPFWEE
ncbi:DUF1127 domain-containing protein [Pseudomonas sp. BN414]|nr:DUF1127 domain-containing protein [Pseudomonas sp. BN414]